MIWPLLEFLEPAPGRSGVSLIQPYRQYHDPKAGDFQTEILKLLDAGETVILDLGNANPLVMAYFSNSLSQAVFAHQVMKFTNNSLGDHFIQVYFEEAHNLFPQTENEPTIYTRFAKEGASIKSGWSTPRSHRLRSTGICSRRPRTSSSPTYPRRMR